MRSITPFAQIARIMRESKQLVNQFSAKEWREVTQLMGYRRDARYGTAAVWR